jgi:hypothetical protein
VKDSRFQRAQQHSAAFHQDLAFPLGLAAREKGRAFLLEEVVEGRPDQGGTRAHPPPPAHLEGEHDLFSEIGDDVRDQEPRLQQREGGGRALCRQEEEQEEK